MNLALFTAPGIEPITYYLRIIPVLSIPSLFRDALAPALKDHTLSQPSLGDLNYILNRWGDRWAADREKAQREKAAAAKAEAFKSRGMGSKRTGSKGPLSRFRGDDDEDDEDDDDDDGVLSRFSSPSKRRADDDAEELWDLDQFGAPTFGPGL